MSEIGLPPALHSARMTAPPTKPLAPMTPVWRLSSGASPLLLSISINKTHDVLCDRHHAETECVNDFATPCVINLLCKVVFCWGFDIPLPEG